MPKVTVTFDFTSEDDAVAFLSGKSSGAPKVEHHAEVLPQATTHMSTQAQHTQATPTEQPAPAPQPATPAAKTPEDVRLAFTAYVQKGQGRTASTAKAILTKHGLNSFREANPEQCATLCAEFANSPAPGAAA